MKGVETSTIINPITLLLGIQLQQNPTISIDSYFEEFINLVSSLGMEYHHTKFIKLRNIDNATFISKGKMEELLKFCEENQIEQIVISEPLSPQQERNLSKFLNVDIIDRTKLILDIFEKNAHSSEGKLQVELAVLQYKKTRLAGRGIYMSQQAGGIGGKGPGETAKEREMQYIEKRISKVKEELKRLEQQRITQSKKRIESKVPLICLIGYTNAGKSTILNTLTKSDVLAENKLFATLDTTTRELYIDGEKKGLISDTVGFIQQIPHKLIEAFKSTLKELEYAHLLLQVVDIADPNWQTQISVVQEVLDELEIDKPMLYVFNKSDKLKNPEDIKAKANKYQPHVFISGTSRETAAPLIDFLKNWHPE